MRRKKERRPEKRERAELQVEGQRAPAGKQLDTKREKEKSKNRIGGNN